MILNVCTYNGLPIKTRIIINLINECLIVCLGRCPRTVRKATPCQSIVTKNRRRTVTPPLNR